MSHRLLNFRMCDLTDFETYWDNLQVEGDLKINVRVQRLMSVTTIHISQINTDNSVIVSWSATRRHTRYSCVAAIAVFKELTSRLTPYDCINDLYAIQN